jgi:hypothetical protein
LEAAGADLGRIHAFDAVRTKEHQGRNGETIAATERPPILPLDLDMIEAAARKRAAALIGIDPVMAYLDPETDAHKDQHVRLVLHRLARLAAATCAAVVLVRHLNKYRSADAIYRGGGSIGIIGAARSGLLVARHPERPNTFVLAVTKSNLGPMPASLEYSLESQGDVGRIAWGQEVEITADELVAPRRGDKSPEAEADKKDRRNRGDEAIVLAALDRLVDRAAGQGSRRDAQRGVALPVVYPTKNKIRLEASVSGDRVTRALTRLVAQGLLEEVPVNISSGRNSKVTRQGTGYRRVPGLTGQSAQSGQ